MWRSLVLDGDPPLVRAELRRPMGESAAVEFSVQRFGLEAVDDLQRLAAFDVRQRARDALERDSPMSRTSSTRAPSSFKQGIPAFRPGGNATRC